MNKKLVIIGGAFVLTIIVIGIGFSLNRGNRVTSPIVETNTASQKKLDIGKPSEGTTHIEQKVDAKNPYTFNDEKAIDNYNKSTEAQLVGKLFDNLNSPTETRILKDLNGVSLGEVQTDTKISADFQAMLWGYSSIDNPQRFLYDGNIIKNFQPHNDLLSYLQMLRPNNNVRVERIGKIIPDLMKNGSNLTTLNVYGKSELYLLQEEVGSVLLKQTDGESTNYYISKFNLYIAIPRGQDALGRPCYIYHQDLKVNVERVTEKDIGQDEKDYLV